MEAGGGSNPPDVSLKTLEIIRSAASGLLIMSYLIFDVISRR
ncbi:MAG: hypothetical protein ACTSWF_01235 [Candidatus Freyarchaeota archaeon]